MRALSPGDAAGGLRLSHLAGWNQTQADWEMMLSRGTGQGWYASGERLVASAVSLPLEPRIDWICMVLVDPDYRRRGLATALMESCLERARAAGRLAMLDATADGEKVYARLGFRTVGRLLRLALKGRPEARTTPVAKEEVNLSPIRSADLDQVSDWDMRMTGLDRNFILRHQWQAWPEAAFCAEGDGALLGLVMGRRGLRASEIGPLVAGDESVAEQLYARVFGMTAGPLFLDAVEEKSAFVERRLAEGWVVERGFARMAHGGINVSRMDHVFASSGPDWS